MVKTICMCFVNDNVWCIIDCLYQFVPHICSGHDHSELAQCPVPTMRSQVTGTEISDNNNINFGEILHFVLC